MLMKRETEVCLLLHLKKSLELKFHLVVGLNGGDQRGIEPCMVRNLHHIQALHLFPQVPDVSPHRIDGVVQELAGIVDADPCPAPTDRPLNMAPPNLHHTRDFVLRDSANSELVVDLPIRVHYFFGEVAQMFPVNLLGSQRDAPGVLRQFFTHRSF